MLDLSDATEESKCIEEILNRCNELLTDKEKSKNKDSNEDRLIWISILSIATLLMRYIAGIDKLEN